MTSGLRLGAVRRKAATAEGVRWGKAPSEAARKRWEGGKGGGKVDQDVSAGEGRAGIQPPTEKQPTQVLQAQPRLLVEERRAVLQDALPLLSLPGVGRRPTGGQGRGGGGGEQGGGGGGGGGGGIFAAEVELSEELEEGVHAVLTEHVGMLKVLASGQGDAKGRVLEGGRGQRGGGRGGGAGGGQGHSQGVGVNYLREGGREGGRRRLA